MRSFSIQRLLDLLLELVSWSTSSNHAGLLLLLLFLLVVEWISDCESIRCVHPGRSECSAALSADGWAWFVSGRHLVVWNYASAPRSVSFFSFFLIWFLLVLAFVSLFFFYRSAFFVGVYLDFQRCFFSQLIDVEMMAVDVFF